MSSSRFIFCLPVVFAGLSLFPCFTSAQNVGIGVPDPSEALQVHGMVYADSAGFRFPDGSVQTRASFDYQYQDAAENRWIVLMDNQDLGGSFSMQGYENMIQVLEFDWGCYHDIDEAIYSITDMCHFKLVTVQKNIDASSTALFYNYIDGNMIGPTRFHFFRYDDQAEDYVRYFRIEFSDMLITHVIVGEKYMGNGNFAHVETVKLSYTLQCEISLHYYGDPNTFYGFQPSDCQ